MIKRVIDGKTYNTDTSTLVASKSGKMGSSREDERSVEWCDELFVNKNGAFYVVETVASERLDTYGDWNTRTASTIVPKTAEEAKDFIETGEVDIHDASVFSYPAEAGEEIKEETFLLRLPSHVKARAAEKAKEEGKSLNAYISGLIEQDVKSRAAALAELANTNLADRDPNRETDRCREIGARTIAAFKKR